MAAFKLEHPYTISKDEARARLQALGEYLQNRHGIKVAWEGDRAAINGKYLIVSIEGQMTVDPGVVRFEGKDPGMLWRGKARDYLQLKLKTYLDPATPADKLPRA